MRILDSFTRIEKAILLCCLAALTYFAGGFFAMSKSRADLPPVFEDAPRTQKLAGAPVHSKSGSAMISVHVAGAVNRPGVLRVAENARIGDALKLAGGAQKNADLNSVNLAQKLKDGEQILLRKKGEAVATSAALSTPGVAGAGNSREIKRPLRPVNVNTASAAELETLPGVGPKTSASIIAARAQKRFRSLDDLDEVKGLGPKKLEKLKPFVLF